MIMQWSLSGYIPLFWCNVHLFCWLEKSHTSADCFESYFPRCLFRSFVRTFCQSSSEIQTLHSFFHLDFNLLVHFPPIHNVSKQFVPAHYWFYCLIRMGIDKNFAIPVPLLISLIDSIHFWFPYWLSLCMLKVFPLLVVIITGVITQKSNYYTEHIS